MRRTVSSWMGMLGLVVVAGCQDPPVEETDVSCRAIGPAGGLVSSFDGVLTLALRPGSLDESTEVCIRPAASPPEGPPVVAGPAYRVSPNVALGVSANVSYRHPAALSPDVAIGVIRLADFMAGDGRWLTLPDARVDTSNTQVTAYDGELSLYYGLMSIAADDGTDGGTPEGSTSGPPMNPDELDASSQTSGGTGGASTGDVASSSATTSAGETASDSTDATTAEGPESTESGAAEEESGDAEESDDSSNDVDCSALLVPPLATSLVDTPGLGPNNEDLAMMGDGTFLIMAGTALMTFDEAGDIVEEVVSGVTGQVLGLVVNDDGAPIFGVGYSQATLPRPVDWVNGGVRETYATGFGLANGLFYARDGAVWVTDFVDNEIVRVAPNRTVEPILSGAPLTTPNGIFVDEDRGRLYWTHYGNAQLWSATLDDDFTPGTPEPIAAMAGSPSSRWDGITMDACGHLYVTDQNQGMACMVYRVELAEDGTAVDGTPLALAEAGELGLGCSAVQFGYGFESDADRSLFVTSPADGRVRRIMVGVEGYPMALPR